MNVKPTSVSGAAPLPLIEDDERHRDAVDSYIARNRDALTASIRLGRQQAAAGDLPTDTVEDLIAEGLKRFSGR